MPLAPDAVDTLMLISRFWKECVLPPARADSCVIP